jgi:YNFM family putative membrane transporter
MQQTKAEFVVAGARADRRVRVSIAAVEAEQTEDGDARDPAIAWRNRMPSSIYLRANVALFAAGFGTFSLLYCVQPLMPVFSVDFGVSPVASSLSLSLTTGVLAITIFVTGFMSESWNRKMLISICLSVASVLTFAAALSPSWIGLLAARFLLGIALGGVPALAMAYLAEEVGGAGFGLAMGIYVGGTALGSMSGRVITGVVAGLWSWRTAIGTAAMLGLWVLLPPSAQFTPRRGLGFRGRAATMNVRGAGLPWLFLTAFLLMGSFVTIYNYSSYRLVAPPYQLTQTAIGAIFLLYLLGTVASPLFGRLADQFGRSPILAISVLLMLSRLLLTMPQSLSIIMCGMALLTFGFFGGHSVASGWVGHLAPTAKGQATSLYLLAYYLGASVVGSYGGRFWARGGWDGVVTLVALLLVVAFVVALRLALLQTPDASPIVAYGLD